MFIALPVPAKSHLLKEESGAQHREATFGSFSHKAFYTRQVAVLVLVNYTDRSAAPGGFTLPSIPTEVAHRLLQHWVRNTFQTSIPRQLPPAC